MRHARIKQQRPHQCQTSPVPLFLLLLTDFQINYFKAFLGEVADTLPNFWKRRLEARLHYGAKNQLFGAATNTLTKTNYLFEIQTFAIRKCVRPSPYMMFLHFREIRNLMIIFGTYFDRFRLLSIVHDVTVQAQNTSLRKVWADCSLVVGGYWQVNSCCVPCR